MPRLAAVALIAALTLAACNKAPPAPPAPPAPSAPPAVAVAPAADVTAETKRDASLSITSADLGTDLGADGRIVTAKENFTPQDTIIVAITATNADAVPVKAQVTARWLDPDGVVFNEESREQDFSGTQAVNFRVADPKGFKPGKYKLEVALNGSTVQMREFSIH
jgi:hypothetical protein